MTACPRECLPGGRQFFLTYLPPLALTLGILFLFVAVVGGMTACSAPPATRHPLASDASDTSEPGAVDGALSGTVRAADGLPAEGVKVRLYVLAEASSESASASLPSEIRTGADGRFAFADPALGKYNLEAVQSEDFKVFRQGVTVRKGKGTEVGYLNLARTGRIAGRVTAPEAPGVTDFLGVDVYIPGSSYVGKTDRAGAYTISGVAPGTFTLVASKAGLGTAVVSEVTVRPDGRTPAPDLPLSLILPRLVAIEPPAAGSGARIQIRGENFGSSSGAVLQVSFNGSPGANPTRLDDRTIEATVPGGGTSGNLSVTVGGLPSNGIPFKVISRFELNPADALLLVGKQVRFAVIGIDTAGERVADPVVTWSMEGGGFRQDGLAVSADDAGTASVIAWSGQASGSATIRAFAGTVVRTVLEPDAVRLGRLADATASLRAVTELSSGATVSYATYVSGEPASVSVSANGGLAAADLTNNGRITVRATSLLDASSIATASVRLSNVATVTTVAGSGSGGYLDGPAKVASFRNVQGLVVDPGGSIFVADMFNSRVRKVDEFGSVTTYAGTGSIGFSNTQYQDGPREQALLYSPVCLALDGAGSLYVGEGIDRIRKVQPDGSVSTVLKGAGNGWTGMAMRPDGGLVLTDFVTLYTLPSGGSLTLLAGGSAAGWRDGLGPAARFEGARGPALDAAGNVYLADTINARIRMATPGGIVRTIAGTGESTHLDGRSEQAKFFRPFGVTWAPDGTLYVADQGDSRIRYITPGGMVGTLAGADGSGSSDSAGPGVLDGPGTAALLGMPTALALGPSGDLFFSDAQCGCVRRVSF